MLHTKNGKHCRLHLGSSQRSDAAPILEPCRLATRQLGPAQQHPYSIPAILFTDDDTRGIAQLDRMGKNQAFNVLQNIPLGPCLPMTWLNLNGGCSLRTLACWHAVRLGQDSCRPTSAPKGDVRVAHTSWRHRRAGSHRATPTRTLEDSSAEMHMRDADGRVAAKQPVASSSSCPCFWAQARNMHCQPRSIATEHAQRHFVPMYSEGSFSLFCGRRFATEQAQHLLYTIFLAKSKG